MWMVVCTGYSQEFFVCPAFIFIRYDVVVVSCSVQKNETVHSELGTTNSTASHRIRISTVICGCMFPLCNSNSNCEATTQPEISMSSASAFFLVQCTFNYCREICYLRCEINLATETMTTTATMAGIMLLFALHPYTDSMFVIRCSPQQWCFTPDMHISEFWCGRRRRIKNGCFFSASTEKVVAGVDNSYKQRIYLPQSVNGSE